jgi:prepilin-type processing-associated H-X9-DG protein/prepilin-type N-terminal cleavage/methylation domain-containing protein
MAASPNTASRLHPGRKRLARPAGFTIVELLVTILIIGTLTSLMVSGAYFTHGMALKAACANRLGEIGSAAMMYRDAHEKYPWAWVSETERWMDQLKPYIENPAVLYVCPADHEKKPLSWDPQFVMSYGINVFRFKDDAHCFWFPVEMNNVRSQRNVILFADCKSGTYFCGGGNRFREPVSGVSYRHAGKSFNALYCDGHVESKIESIKADWDASQ